MLAIIAGRGLLPRILFDRSGGKDVIVTALEGFEPEGLPVALTFRIERLGSFLKELSKRGVTEVCFAGGIERPQLNPTKIDAATLPLVPRMLKALGQGDDAALRIVLETFEEKGFRVRAAHELAPDLIPPVGQLGRHKPAKHSAEDIEKAKEVIALLGAADIGQACVIRRHQVLALEAMPGTAHMLGSIAGLGHGGILFKAPKPSQDRRIDLPAIGPDTIKQAAKAGLEGVVIAQDGVMILDRRATIEAADRLDLFLEVVAP